MTSNEYLVKALSGKISPFKKADNLIEIASMETIPDSIFIEGESFSTKKIDIKNLIFRDEIGISITFKKCHFKTLFLSNLNNLSSLNFINCTVESLCVYGKIARIAIQGGSFRDIQFSGERLLSTLVINEMLDSIIDRLDLSSNIDNIDIDNLKVNKLTLSKTTREARWVNIRNVYVDILTFLKFDTSTEDTIVLDSIKPNSVNKSKVFFINSRPENIHFTNCNFKDFLQLEVSNAWLDKVSSDNTTWFDRIVKKGSVEEDTFTYRLLKSAMQRQHDYISELYFRSKELDSYLKALPFRKNKSEWLLLSLNKISNNHGIDWWHGVKFTFIVSFLLFCSYIFSLESYPYKFGWENWEIFIDAVSTFIEYFSKFFLITHSMDFMLKFRPSGMSFMIDIFSRIAIGYAIYQTIQAFRKFGK